MKQPQGLIKDTDKIYRLKKSLYVMLMCPYVMKNQNELNKIFKLMIYEKPKLYVGMEINYKEDGILSQQTYFKNILK